MVFCNGEKNTGVYTRCYGHNPYFNRWFSAIKWIIKFYKYLNQVTILILIDGFLQSRMMVGDGYMHKTVTILILIDGFLQCYLGWQYKL